MHKLSEQKESQRFFVLDQVPQNLESVIVPIAQLANLQTIDILALQKLIAFGMPQQSGSIRQYVWKLVLGYLPKQRKRWTSHVQQQQQLYQSFLEQFLNPQKYKSAPLDCKMNHLDWTKYESDFKLWDQVEKDTCRTHAELSFFSQPAESLTVPFYTSTRRQKYKLISGDQELQHFGPKERKTSYNYDYMTRILFIFASLNPKAAYVQGMNQILAPVFYLINANSGRPIQEAACFFMFNNVMSDIVEIHINDFGNQIDNPIHSKIKKISTLLLAIRPKIWQKLDQLKIQPFLYCFRWIALLFSQQFQMYQTLKIWESIFSHQDRSTFTIYIALSMLICGGDAIATGDYSDVMAHLKSLGKSLNVDKVIQLASSLYQKYGQSDLCQMALKNKRKLQEPRQESKLISLFKRLF